jgi:hypothetical protein
MGTAGAPSKLDTSRSIHINPCVPSEWFAQDVEEIIAPIRAMRQDRHIPMRDAAWKLRNRGHPVHVIAAALSSVAPNEPHIQTKIPGLLAGLWKIED